MREKIKDCKGHFACIADAETGEIEQKYKRTLTRTNIPVGGKYTIERDDTVTVLRRVSTEEFEITSYEIAS